MAAVGVTAFVAFAFWRGSRKGMPPSSVVLYSTYIYNATFPEERTEEKVNTTSPAAAQSVVSATFHMIVFFFFLLFIVEN